MSGDLTKYNAAKRALAEAVRIDEVKDIRDKAVAMRLYASQAKDRELIDQATEIRLRAERRAGELLTDMEKNKGGAEHGVGRRGKNAVAEGDRIPKLSDLNINKSQSSRWQKLADISDDDFEELVGKAKQKACAAVDRAQQPAPRPKPKRKPSTKKDSAEIVAACVSEVEAIVRAAISGMDADERAGLFDQLQRAVRMLMGEAFTEDADDSGVRRPRKNGPDPDLSADRWTETH